jgi:hypothetical protein
MTGVFDIEQINNREAFVAANRHAGQVGYFHSLPQEVRDDRVRDHEAQNEERSLHCASAKSADAPVGMIPLRKIVQKGEEAGAVVDGSATTHKRPQWPRLETKWRTGLPG